MKKLEAPKPYEYVYQVIGGKVLEYVLIRENRKSFCVRFNNNWNKKTKNLKKELSKSDLWFSGMHINCTLVATVRNMEIAVILCHMAYRRCKRIKSKHREVK